MVSIGELARRSGVKVATIRYYERNGLMDPADRTAGNQRRYGASAVGRLMFIRRARALGFSLDAIRALMALGEHPDRPCADVDRIARDHLADVEERLRSLHALKGELQSMIEQCHGGAVARCRVLEVLADQVPRHSGQ